MTKENFKLGGANIILGGITTKDGKVFDQLEVTIIDPVSGNTIKVTGIIPDTTAKYSAKKKINGKEVKFNQKYISLSLNGVKLNGEADFDWNFKPKFFKVIPQYNNKPQETTNKNLVDINDLDVFGV